MTLIVGGFLLAVAELAVLVEVAKQIGVLPAIVLLLVVSACGPWLVRRAGFATWRRLQERVRRSEVPGRELVDGALLLVAGVLITVPGFITDAVGLLLLLPPARTLVRVGVIHRLGRRIAGRPGAWAAHAGGPIVDAATHRSRPVDPDAPTSPRAPSDRPPPAGGPPEIPPAGDR